MIFSRGRRAGRHSRPEEPADRSAGVPGPDGDEAVDLPAGTGDAEAVREVGPYDIEDAPEAGVQLLDLGSMLIPVLEGVEVRVEADAEGAIRQVVLANRNSTLELAVFAAPRTEGIWAETREEIRAALAADRVTATEVQGRYGAELLARVRTPGGPADIRFVGIDGPRWMVRAVYQGRAATDPAAAAVLDGCLHGLVVNRGSQAMPVREALPLRLPHEMAGQLAAAAAGSVGGNAPDARKPAAAPVDGVQRSRPPGGRSGRQGGGSTGRGGDGSGYPA